MIIGVIAVQGAISQHINIVNTAFEHLGINGKTIKVTEKSDISLCDALILPGGESTTISKLIHRNSIASALKKGVEEGKPLMGTCAGSILLAKRGDEQIVKTKTQLLEIMDITVKRNVFGRQKESFQIPLDIKHIGRYDCIFIRAPGFIESGDKVEILATYNDYIVAAQHRSVLAIAFHPELTGNSAIHEYFIKMIH